MLNDATRDFIRQHADADVRQLALRGSKDAAVDMTLALQQIAGRQTARRKLPSWAAVDGILYPPHLNMEQCSSERTARYKQVLVQRLTAGREDGLFVDLTGGFGVDFYYMAQPFHRCLYVEQNAQLCAISSENFRLLGLPAEVVCGLAADVLPTLGHATAIFLDPARRDDHGARTYALADCTPNVLELLPRLADAADCVVLKLSPMLDWHKAVSDLQSAVSAASRSLVVTEVHIVSTDNECKELLIVLETGTAAREVALHCANLRADGTSQDFIVTVGSPSACTTAPAPQCSSSAPAYLYEPNASIMKAGCFDEVERRFGLRQIARQSHLFVSASEKADFPGRKFQILSISSMNKREISRRLAELDTAGMAPMIRANVSVRNFPLSADALRQKLKLGDGGNLYIFATTLADGSHKLFFCRKIG